MLIRDLQSATNAVEQAKTDQVLGLDPNMDELIEAAEWALDQLDDKRDEDVEMELSELIVEHQHTLNVLNIMKTRLIEVVSRTTMSKKRRVEIEAILTQSDGDPSD